MKNRNYLDARSGIIERSRRIFDIAFRSIQLGCLYPKRENSRQAWKWLAKSLQCVLWQTVSGLLRSVHLWLVGVSIGSAHKCFRGMNEQDTPLEPFQAAQLLRGRSEREKERESESRDAHLASSTFAVPNVSTLGEDNRSRGWKRKRPIYIVCFSDFADFKCKLRIIGRGMRLLLERDYRYTKPFSPFFQLAGIERILFVEEEASIYEKYDKK